MKNPLVLTLSLSLLLMASFCAADASKIISDTPVEKIREIHQYFSKPANRQKTAPDSLETKYSWQNMDRFYPTTRIQRAGAVVFLPKAIDAKIGKLKFRHGRDSLSVDEHLDRYPVDAFLVVRHGKIVYERYNTMKLIDKHNWWSNGKVIGSTMLAILEAEGKIDVKQKVSRYLQELKGSAWESVTVEEALDMATGLDSTEHDEPAHDSRTNPKQGWFRWSVSIGMYPDILDANENAYDVLRSMKRRKPPYQAFEYNSINTFVINRIVEKVTHKPLNLVFSERVWQKMGAIGDGYVAVSAREGYPLFYGMTSSTLEDMARFGMLFTPSWKTISDEEVLTPEIVNKIQTVSHPEIYAKGFMGKLMHSNFPDDKRIGNHYQWDAVFADGDLYKSGFGGQGIYISPARDLVIVWFGTNDGKGGESTMARAIAKSFAWNNEQ